MLIRKLFTLCMTLACSCALLAAEQPLDRIAVIVDEGIIMQSQFDKRLSEVRKNIARRGAELPPEDVLRQQVLDRMIIDEIQLQIGERSGIYVADEELNEAMTNLAKHNQISLEQLLASFAADGLNQQDVREQIRSEIIINRVRQYRVDERVQVTEQEVKNFLNSALGKMQLGEEYHLANILIPLSDSPNADEIATAEKKVTELMQRIMQGDDFQQLAMSYSASENALEGGDMGWRKAAQLPPPFDSMLASMHIGQVTEPMRTAGGIILIKLLDKAGEQQDSWNEEVLVRHILIKPSEIRTDKDAQQLAERIYQRLQQGEDFSALAQNFSEDPGSALNGGELGWMNPDSLVPEFRQTMSQTAINELSKPFASQFGWHVLQVLDRRMTDSSNEVREQQALNAIHNRKYEEELQVWLREIRDDAYVEIKEL